MKLSHVITATERRTEVVVAPSPVHAAFVEVLGELAALANRTGHPVARILHGVVPSILPDVAEIPTDTLSELCRRLGTLMLRVANAEEEAPPSLAAIMESENDALPRQTVPARDEG